MYKLLEAKGLLMTEEETEEVKVTEMINEYSRMKPDKFKLWVGKLGQVKWGEYPIPVQQDIISKWGRFYEDIKKDPFPY